MGQFSISFEENPTGSWVTQAVPAAGMDSRETNVRKDQQHADVLDALKLAQLKLHLMSQGSFQSSLSKLLTYGGIYRIYTCFSIIKS